MNRDGEKAGPGKAGPEKASPDKANRDPGERDREEPIVAKLVKAAGDLPAVGGDEMAEAQEPTSDSMGQPNEVIATGSPFAETSSKIRSGSPFANEPEDLWDDFLPSDQEFTPESFYDVGPLKYTAIGAVAAAVMVLAFAAASSWWFPGGGTLIAALGCTLSVFGLYSPHKRWAGVCLMLHLMLFLFSYSRAVMV
jgi:hypothetical protein